MNGHIVIIITQFITIKVSPHKLRNSQFGYLGLKPWHNCLDSIYLHYDD